MILTHTFITKFSFNAQTFYVDCMRTFNELFYLYISVVHSIFASNDPRFLTFLEAYLLPLSVIFYVNIITAD